MHYGTTQEELTERRLQRAAAEIVPHLKQRCPHCDNTDSETIFDNGCDGVDLVLCCMAEIPEGEQDAAGSERDEAIAGGYLDEGEPHRCGMQWSPWDEAPAEEIRRIAHRRNINLNGFSL